MHLPHTPFALPSPVELRAAAELSRSSATAAARWLVGRTLLAATLVAGVRPHRVVDVGCKGGWLLGHLAEQTDAELLVGVDLDPQLPQVQPGCDRAVRVLAGDARRLPVRASWADAVCMFEVLEHLPAGSEPAALAEAARALRPGGLLFCSTPAAWLPGTLLDPAWWLIGHRHYPMRRLLELICGAGLEVRLATTRGGWAEVFGVPLYYTTRRLGLPLPARAFWGRWLNRSYQRADKYDHLVVAQKPEAVDAATHPRHPGPRRR